VTDDGRTDRRTDGRINGQMEPKTIVAFGFRR
jgi:hypothetical protein